MEWRKTICVITALLLVAGCRLTVGIEGEGTVTSDNNKIDCPGDCKAKLKRGKEITLTATPDEGQYFAGWKGCDTESEDSCVVVGKNKNRKVTAMFAVDSTLEDADLAASVERCALNNDLGLTTALSTIKQLVCNGLEDNYGDRFETRGIQLLASLESLDISHVPIDSLTGISQLRNLKTLKLVGVGLTDVSPLRDLNAEKLSTVDLQNNPQLDCNDLEELEDLFVNVTFAAQQCENNDNQ